MMLERTIIPTLGGTRLPIDVAAQMMETVWPPEYPLRRRAGAMRDPIAEMSATVDPEMPEKMYSATSETIPSPPRTCPTSTCENFTRRREIPPVSIRDPARI